MNTARMRNISMLALLALVAACTRSASTPPPGEGEGETPADSQQATMEAVRSALLTQTAEAGGGGEVVPTEAPPEATAMPEEEVKAEPTDDGMVYVEYTVQEGDFVATIAQDFGVDPQAIVDLNGLGSPSEVTVGMVLKIPPSTGPVSTPEPTSVAGGGGTVHIVQPGEWIWQIARTYAVDPNAIIEANDLANPGLIFPGLELIIP
ncbi:MAG: LysM peptidoglycan-binding domain-containing protein [Chloroflexi bacterium]|nr:LysM peptidoglycan-binding domain-containing protein [Chloroflexota bacterium]MCI0806630.1 LysM peptidoglycan-binding domain-containing protein [Chloroflexota bacterium]